jgi:lipopolysaccharide transport system permease protein
VKGRYSQSLFGVGWAIAQPLATMAVFTLVFARLGAMPSGGAPYPLLRYAALVPWFFFSNSVNSGTMSLVTYRNIVTKTYFPREIVPLAQVCSRMVDLAASATLYALLMAYYRGLARPVGGVGAAVPRDAHRLHDRHDADHVVAQRLLPGRQSGRANLAAAVAVSHAGAYPLSAVPEKYRWFFLLNPLTAIVEGLRSSLVFGRAPDWQVVAISAALIGLLLVVSATMFKRMDKYFADVI